MSEAQVPAWMSQEAVDTLSRGYLRVGETPRGMFERVAKTGAKYLTKTPGIEEDLFEIFWRGYIGGASPVISNFGANSGLPISCYSNHISDSVPSIYSHLKESAALSQHGGGVGTYFGDVRPAGAPISSGGGKSTGVVPWMRQYDQCASVVSQGGVRRGSFALYLPIDHPDLPEVLRTKDHSQGDPRDFVDSNIAVTITDEWVESLLSGDKNKQKLFGEVLKARLVSGSPYIIFIDNANRANPECYTQRGLSVKLSNLCFTGDTLVAVADGRNAVPISELVGTHFNVYSARKRKSSGNGFINKWVTEVKPAIAFKTGTKEIIEVELEDGSTFRCTPDHLLARRDCSWVEAKDSVGEVLEPFSSFVNGCGHRMINTVSNGTARQSRMIWENKNGPVPQGYHVDHIVSQGGDNIENLQLLTKEDHLAKTAQERLGKNNPIHKVDSKFHSEYVSAAVTGKKNPLFSGIDNYELIQLGKRVYQKVGSFTKKDYLSLREEGYNVPQSFSNYRFGGSFEEYRSYVIGEKQYNGEYEITLKAPTNERKLKNQLLELEVSQLKTNGLKVVSVRPAGTEDVYDLTVEDNHNFYIVTDQKENSLLSGVLVHNCSEIFLHTDENHTFVCVLSSLNLARWEEWKDWKGPNTGKSVPELAIYLLDAVVEEFCHKAERITSMGRAVRFARKSRALGLGTMGLHALYQSKGLPFASPEARKLNIEVHKFIKEKALKASQEMAATYGEPEWCQGTGLRHTHLMAVAPTKSNSVICGAGSEGIEPIDANYYVAKQAKGTFVRKNKYLVEHLERIGRNTDETWESIMEFRGSVQHLGFLDSATKEVFKTAREINQFELVRQASDRQPYICQGQSLNLFVDPEATPEYLFMLHLSAWKAGLKSLYYLKSSSLLVKKKAPGATKVAKIVTKEACPYCSMAKSLLRSQGWTIKETDRADVPDSEWHWKTVPQIWLNGQYVGGYTELAERLGQGEKTYGECVACEG
jgi:ribonucleoside-diphosphate reductase alpha chain